MGWNEMFTAVSNYLSLSELVGLWGLRTLCLQDRENMQSRFWRGKHEKEKNNFLTPKSVLRTGEQAKKSPTHCYSCERFSQQNANTSINTSKMSNRFV